MYNSSDILAKLRQGISPDDLAKEFTDAINLANKTYEAEKKAKEAAEKKLAEEREAKALRETEKIEYLDSILDDFDDWYAEYYDGDSPLVNIDAESVISAIEATNKFVDNFHSLFTSSILKDGKLTTSTTENKNGKISTKSSTKKIDVDSIINEFLKEFNL